MLIVRILVVVSMSMAMVDAHNAHHNHHDRENADFEASSSLPAATNLHSTHTRASAVKASKRAAIEQVVRFALAKPTSSPSFI